MGIPVLQTTSVDWSIGWVLHELPFYDPDVYVSGAQKSRDFSEDIVIPVGNEENAKSALPTVALTVDANFQSKVPVKI